jgi:hypothetical protein
MSGIGFIVIFMKTWRLRTDHLGGDEASSRLLKTFALHLW